MKREQYQQRADKRAENRLQKSDSLKQSYCGHYMKQGLSMNSQIDPKMIIIPNPLATTTTTTTITHNPQIIVIIHNQQVTIITHNPTVTVITRIYLMSAIVIQLMTKN